jgi:hypothetical protein
MVQTAANLSNGITNLVSDKFLLLVFQTLHQGLFDDLDSLGQQPLETVVKGLFGEVGEVFAQVHAGELAQGRQRRIWILFRRHFLASCKQRGIGCSGLMIEDFEGNLRFVCEFSC